MYLPSPFAESRPGELHRIIRQHPFGMLITHSATGLDANHLPFVLDPGRGPLGTLLAHVARANPVWTGLADGDPVLVVFRGAHGYISPNWYASTRDTPRQAPTWNYQAVHAHGRVRIFHDDRTVRDMVARLVDQQEAPLPQPWKMSDAPENYLAENIAQLMGMEIEITRLEGQQKLSQNREPRDIASTLAALEERGEAELASEMRRMRREAPGDPG